MRTIKLTLQYDGTRFGGWQIQPDVPTVQGEILDAIERALGERVELHGAGRTDAGVHALGQVAHFRTASRLPADEIQRAVHAHLARDISVTSAEEVADDFHARYSATSKRYLYCFDLSKVPVPVRRRYACPLQEGVDFVRIREALPFLIGRHDFAAFATRTPEDKDTVRTIRGIRLRVRRTLAYFVFEGDGFLRNMVRAIVGTLVQVGRGRLAPGAIPEILESRDRARAGPTAPPQGLFLLRVRYKK